MFECNIIAASLTNFTAISFFIWETSYHSVYIYYRFCIYHNIIRIASQDYASIVKLHKLALKIFQCYHIYISILWCLTLLYLFTTYNGATKESIWIQNAYQNANIFSLVMLR